MQQSFARKTRPANPTQPKPDRSRLQRERNPLLERELNSLPLPQVLTLLLVKQAHTTLGPHKSQSLEDVLYNNRQPERHIPSPRPPLAPFVPRVPLFS